MRLVLRYVTVIKPETPPENLVEDPDNAWVNEQIPEWVAPWRLPADEIPQIFPASRPLKCVRAT